LGDPSSQIAFVLPVPLHCMDEATGDAAVAYDAAASVFVAAVRLPRFALSPTILRPGVMFVDNGDGTLTIEAARRRLGAALQAAARPTDASPSDSPPAADAPEGEGRA